MNLYAEMGFHLKQLRLAADRLDDAVARNSIYDRVDRLQAFVSYLCETENRKVAP